MSQSHHRDSPYARFSALHVHSAKTRPRGATRRAGRLPIGPRDHHSCREMWSARPPSAAEIIPECHAANCSEGKTTKDESGGNPKDTPDQDRRVSTQKWCHCRSECFATDHAAG